MANSQVSKSKAFLKAIFDTKSQERLKKENMIARE